MKVLLAVPSHQSCGFWLLRQVGIITGGEIVICVPLSTDSILWYSCSDRPTPLSEHPDVSWRPRDWPWLLKTVPDVFHQLLVIPPSSVVSSHWSRTTIVPAVRLVVL